MRSLKRLRPLVGGQPVRQEFDERLREEMEEHLALMMEEHERAGMTKEEARRQAILKLGPMEAIREEYQREVGGVFVQTLLQDMRYALRTLTKAPGFTAVVVLTLALGIGANAAIFSVVNAVLLQPLPYVDPGRIVSVSQGRAKDGIPDDGMSYPTFEELRDHNRVFSAAAGLAAHALTLTGRGEPADMSTVAVTQDFFSVLGVKPMLGRTLLPEDGRKGAAPVVVLSEALWRSRFGADGGILGQTITLDQRPYTVVGVMPASFRTPGLNQTVQEWIPLIQDPLFGSWLTREGHWMPVLARLRPGVSVEQASAELEIIGKNLTSKIPSDTGWVFGVQPLQEAIVGDVKTPLILLLCAVGLVLLIACSNIANLLLARATSRSKEIAVRVALGASKTRIARQLLTVSAILGLLGGAAGLALAWAGVSAMSSLLPPALPKFHSIHVDGPVLIFALLLSLAASLIFGLAPVFLAARSDPQENLREGTRGGESKGPQRARNILAIAEVALAMVLLAGAGLLLRSFARLLRVSPGFATAHVVKANVSLPRFQYSKPEQWTAFANELMTRLQARPGMRDSAIVVPTPIVDGFINLSFTIAGNPPLAPGATQTADYVTASPRYFQVMGIPLLRGRLFSLDDSASTPMVAVISESFARRYFPNQDPLGRHIVFGFPPRGNVSREIVGVVADIHDVSLAKNAAPMMYVPFAQAPIWGGDVVVRSRLSTAEVADAIRAETGSIDKNLPVTEVESLPAGLHESVASQRFRTLLLGVFSGVALLLAAIGVYGVVSFSVSRRTREIGVRMALGATPANIRRVVIGESARLVLLGLATGIPAALILTHFLSALLFGIKATDPITFLGVALLLILVALVAAYLPARRAMRVDPIVALRCE